MYKNNQKPLVRETRILDRIFIRNYAIFFFLLVLCTGSILYILISGDKRIDRIDERVKHAQFIILETSQISALVEGMVAAQRGFIITSGPEFLKEYQQQRDGLSQRIARITELLSDNKSQTSRVDEMRNYFTELSTRLDERSKKHMPLPIEDQIALSDHQAIDTLKANMLRLTGDILEEEYGLLNKRVGEVNRQKTNYFISLVIGVVLSSAMMLLFNGFFLQLQRRSTRIEASLKDTEERFALAAEGTQDGIFDWDMISNEVFYSKSFFGMLGYDREAFIGTPDDIRSLVHLEDFPRVTAHVEDYLKGVHKEYIQEFRLQHREGHWIWVQSRAKALYDDMGKPVRMVGAHTDITHAKEQHAKLELEKREAEEANRAKSDFLAHMSHEIRTPLTAISGIAEIFEKNMHSLNETQQKLVRTLHSSTSALKDLINDILDFSKIEGGELELVEEAFSLDDFFKDVTNIMSMRAHQKGLSFIFDYRDVEDTVFVGDKMRMRQILVNLIGNAVKFTSEGAITIKAFRDMRDSQMFLRIDVTDTGPGIAPDNFDLIFERFKQADASVSRKYGGTGLGLAISRSLAKLMGGSLILTSQLGAGSTFSLIVPHKHTEDDLTEADDSSLNQRLAQRIIATKNEGSSILLVEDYEGNIVVLSHLLEELEFSFDVARTGFAALDFWRNGHYDIILMDIQMPEMDGFRITRIIRDMERENNLPRTPIIGMTAHALVGDKDKCIAAGMDSYLPKPIVEKDLKQQILKYLILQKKAA